MDLTAPDAIEVVETKELDLYDVTVLKASDPDDLQDWLNAHGFQLPADAPSVLAHYTNDAFYFLAVRIDLLNRHQDDVERLRKHDLWDTVKDVAVSVPTTNYSFRAPFLSLDDRLERLYSSFGHYAIALATDVAFHVIRGEPYPRRLEGFFPRVEYDRLLQAGPRIALPKRIGFPFGLMGERDEPNTTPSHVVLPDGEAVKDSLFKLCETLIRLRLGMAKPLKISFTPAEPVFPLHISRINTSDVTVTGYVFAAEPLKDESDTLAISAYKELTCGFRDTMSAHLDISACRFVTKLTFEGPSTRFDEDARFVAMNDEERQGYTDRTENFYRAIEEGDTDYVRNHVTDLPDINAHYSGEVPSLLRRPRRATRHRRIPSEPGGDRRHLR